jgi:hypothetical protein
MLLAIAVMSLAVMLTLSRGALLAAGCGLFALAAAALAGNRPRAAWRRVGPPVATAVVVFIAFQFCAGMFSSVAITQKHAEGGDSGRSNIHAWGLDCMDTWDKHLAGAGLWEPEARLESLTGGNIDHLHSLPVATYVHSGVAGSVLLLTITVLGLVRAWRLARRGSPQWLALLACGIGGLMFDGQSACSLVTHPRFENLLFWFPLIAIFALWRNERENHPGRQPSSNPSR